MNFDEKVDLGCSWEIRLGKDRLSVGLVDENRS